MSSRNRYLSSEERARALCLSQALSQAEAMMQAGERDAEVIKAAVRDRIALDAVVDYVELVEADTIRPVVRVGGPVLLAVAAKLGETRLIDNIKFNTPETV
jgi:pantoate--beta-alanine ligase